MANVEESSTERRAYPLDSVAAVFAHELNRAYCQLLGDESQPSWNDAPQWMVDSAEAGARAIIEGAITTPADSHASWMRLKLATGWSYGEVKDVVAKTHPCLVPYAELPREQQLKDLLFFLAVKSTIAFADQTHK